MSHAIGKARPEALRSAPNAQWRGLWAVVMVAVALAAPGASGQSASCVVSTQPLIFGAYDVAATTALTTTARIDVRCALPTSVTLGLQSANPSLGSQMRTMRHSTATDSIVYALFQDVAQSQVWGDGVRQSGRTLRVNGSNSVFVYGVIAAGQDPTVGEYRDALSVLVLP